MSDSLPNYSVRFSGRAKRMYLRVMPGGYVEVVVPRGCDPGMAAPFVHKHRGWLLRTLVRLDGSRADVDSAQSPPQRIVLTALGETYAVGYDALSLGRIELFDSAKTALTPLRVRADDCASIRLALRQWLHQHARARLVPRLRQLSRDLELPFAAASVRAQKTLWGSCTARNNISINRNLLFLPLHLVHYVFVHELCHTVYLNHSKRYWALLGRLVPQHRAMEAELRKADSYIPMWAHPD